ncbi:hypothetical protein DFH09DRAFT_1285271 [Mycena vulgaris]|nr:hypothetical protein DFH09DRAFT_1285271 [Mycena vulgaris]
MVESDFSAIPGARQYLFYTLEPIARERNACFRESILRGMHTSIHLGIQTGGLLRAQGHLATQVRNVPFLEGLQRGNESQNFGRNNASRGKSDYHLVHVNEETNDDQLFSPQPLVPCVRQTDLIPELQESNLVGRHELPVSVIEGQSVFLIESEVVVNVGEQIFEAHCVQRDPQHQAHQRIPEARRTSAAETRPPIDATDERTAVNASIEVCASGIIGGNNLLDLPQGMRSNETEGVLHVLLVRNQMFARVAAPVPK